MKLLRAQRLSARGSSLRGTRFPAISRRLCQKFARNGDSVAGTLIGIRGLSRNPRWLRPLGTILLTFAPRRLSWRAQDQHHKRIAMDRRLKNEFQPLR